MMLRGQRLAEQYAWIASQTLPGTGAGADPLSADKQAEYAPSAGWAQEKQDRDAGRVALP